MKPLRLVALGAVGAIALTACGDSSSDSEGRRAVDVHADVHGRRPARRPPARRPRRRRRDAGDDRGARPRDGARRRTFLSTAVDGFTLVDGTQVSLTFDGAEHRRRGRVQPAVVDVDARGRRARRAVMAQTEMACEPAGADGPGHVAGLGADVAADRQRGRRHADDRRRRGDRDAPRRGGAHPGPPRWRARRGSSTPCCRATSRRRSRPASTPRRCCSRRARWPSTPAATPAAGRTRVVGDTVTFGPIAMTRMACTDPATIAIEPQVLAVLQRHGDGGDRGRRPHAAQRHERARRPRRPGRADAGGRRPRRSDVDLESATVDGARAAASGADAAFDGRPSPSTPAATRQRGYARRTTITFQPIAIA